VVWGSGWRYGQSSCGSEHSACRDYGITQKRVFYPVFGLEWVATRIPSDWEVERFVSDTGLRVALTVENRTARLRTWKYEVMVQSGYALQVFLLDSDLPKNSDWDRTLTRYLYGRDAYYRLYQEAIFGIGGV